MNSSKKWLTQTRIYKLNYVVGLLMHVHLLSLEEIPQ